MRRKLCLILLYFLVARMLAGAAETSSNSRGIRVETDAGIVKGSPWGAGGMFLGIPYAAAPIGDLRWRPPQPVRRWQGVRDATTFGAPCAQLPAKWFHFIPGQEDCLYLNVWSPRLRDDARLPVLVYLHGGSNTQGYGQMTPLGPALSKSGLVVVSLNYRLGPFGFLALRELSAESPHGSSGNYGLLDQLQALRWVKKNIAQFGGDAERVTVMGQSAGAVDACLLMTSPLAAGLFQRAILESGECQSTLNEDIRGRIPYNFISGAGETNGERLAHDLAAEDGTVNLARLRAIPAEQILAAWKHDSQLNFGAIVDGWVVPRQPSEIFARGKQMRIPVLVGSNSDEATVFGHNDVRTVSELRNYFRADTGEYSGEESRLYPATSEADAAGVRLEAENDSFTYGAYSLAEAVTHFSQKAYLYYFTYTPAGKRARLGAHHGEELFFLSESFPDGWEISPDDQQFGSTIRGYWVRFIKTADPNSPGSPEWLPYAKSPGDSFDLGHRIGPRRVDARIIMLQRIMRKVTKTDPIPNSYAAPRSWSRSACMASTP